MISLRNVSMNGRATKNWKNTVLNNQKSSDQQYQKYNKSLFYFFHSIAGKRFFGF